MQAAVTRKEWGKLCKEAYRVRINTGNTSNDRQNAARRREVLAWGARLWRRARMSKNPNSPMTMDGMATKTSIRAMVVRQKEAEAYSER